MTRDERLKRTAFRAEAKQAKALVIWTRWRKLANARAADGSPMAMVLAARGQRQAAVTRWARAREAARKARFKASLAWDFFRPMKRSRRS